MSDVPLVAVVDDDDDVLDSLSALLSRRGTVPKPFATAEALLAALEGGQEFDCIVSDIRMPGMSGTALQAILAERAISTPLILVTGHGDVDLAVAAMKAGAADFIEKPINSTRLVGSVTACCRRHRLSRKAELSKLAIRQRFDGLSDRQREVMQLTVKGCSNKEMAQLLKLSSRTVEHYREWVMEKMHARNLADLVQMAMQLGLLEPST